MLSGVASDSQEASYVEVEFPPPSKVAKKKQRVRMKEVFSIWCASC